jgi:hypothetical protein
VPVCRSVEDPRGARHWGRIFVPQTHMRVARSREALPGGRLASALVIPRQIPSAACRSSRDPLGFVVSHIREIENARQKRLEQQPETGPTPWFGSSRRWRPFGAFMRRRRKMGLMCLRTPNTRSGVSRDQGRLSDTALRVSRRVDGIRALNLRDDAAAQRPAPRRPYSESARPDRDIAQPVAEPHPRCVRCYRYPPTIAPPSSRSCNTERRNPFRRGGIGKQYGYIVT